MLLKIRGILPWLVATKHFPESKTLPRIQKHVPETKTLPRNQNTSQNPKTRPRILDSGTWLSGNLVWPLYDEVGDFPLSGHLCAWNCEIQIKRNSKEKLHSHWTQLRSHIVMASRYGSKPFECIVCRKCFTTDNGRAQHQRDVHGYTGIHFALVSVLYTKTFVMSDAH